MSNVIYQATNRETGDFYIGVTKQRLNDRRLKHYSDADNGVGNCKKFHAAIRKYGRLAFDWSVLGDFGDDRDLALIGEIEFIAKFQPEYNISTGGRAYGGGPKSAEHIEKVASQLRGRKRTPEQLERFRQVRADPSYRSNQAAKSSRAVICIETGERFPSALSAAKRIGLSGGAVSGAARGDFQTAGGFHFKYENGRGK